MNKKSVGMSRRVALAWLEEKINPFYSLTIYYKDGNPNKLTDVLRSFRDNKLKIPGVPTIDDLGMNPFFDGIHMWSANKSNILILKDWFEKHGYETSGIW